MLATLRKTLRLKWKSTESSVKEKSLLLVVFVGILEDVLFWKRTWLSASIILFFNVIFFVGSYQDTKFLVLVTYVCLVLISVDGLEAWLKYKHRTSFLKQLASRNNTKLYTATTQTKQWIQKKWNDFLFLRESNHTKAFLLTNILFGSIYIVGRFIDGFTLLYLLTMLAASWHYLAPLTQKVVEKIHIVAESDGELESLIPEVSDKDLQDLSFEPEQKFDERQSLDYWKPNEEIPGEDVSDSSEHSSSLATNLSMEKLQAIEREVETSDSSDDEYIPLVKQKEQLQSTLEEIQHVDSWGGSAFNMLRNLTGAMASAVYPTEEAKRKPLLSNDSSDGFEMIDKNDLL